MLLKIRKKLRIKNETKEVTKRKKRILKIST
jgi:hypothetical protein